MQTKTEKLLSESKDSLDVSGNVQQKPRENNEKVTK